MPLLMGTGGVQYTPRNRHTFFALLCFVVVIHWLIFPYPSGLLHWHCGNLTIAPVPAKQTWWIWINTSCEFIMNNCITTTKQSTTKPCAYFLGVTVSTKQHSTCLLHWCWSNRMIYYGHGVHEVTQKIWINKSYVWWRDDDITMLKQSTNKYLDIYSDFCVWLPTFIFLIYCILWNIYRKIYNAELSLEWCDV